VPQRLVVPDVVPGQLAQRLPGCVDRGRPVALPGGVHRGYLVRCGGGELAGAGRAGARDLLAGGDDVLLGGPPLLVLAVEVTQVLHRLPGLRPGGVVQPEAELGADLRVAGGLHAGFGAEVRQVAAEHDHGGVVGAVAGRAAGTLGQPGPDPLGEHRQRLDALVQEPFLQVHAHRQAGQDHQAAGLVRQVDPVIPVGQGQDAAGGLGELLRRLGELLRLPHRHLLGHHRGNEPVLGVVARGDEHGLAEQVQHPGGKAGDALLVAQAAEQVGEHEEPAAGALGFPVGRDRDPGNLALEGGSVDDALLLFDLLISTVPLSRATRAADKEKLKNLPRRGVSARDRSPAPCCEADCAGRRNADEWHWRRLTRRRSNQHGHGMAPRMWPSREDGWMVLPSDVPPTGWGRRAPDRRREEIRRLLALMGGAIAALYEDACRLLVTEPQLATASHLVAHLAREIESGLRELLTAMVPASRMAGLEALPREPGQRGPGWKAVVDEICTALGFTAGDEVRSLWKSARWDPRAHRGALLRPRPIDGEFRAAWRDFEVLLHRVGRQYEATYLAALPLVDALAAIGEPSKEDLSRLRHQVPHGVVALRRFFERAGAGWFARLRPAGYLSDPPGLRPTEDGLVAYTPWPAGRYLVRMAQVASLADAVADVALGLDTDNPEACECVAEAALVLPADAAARLAPRLAAFLTQPIMWALPVKAGEVVVTLAAAGQTEAALTVLGPLLPTDVRSAAGRRYFPRELVTRAFPNLGLPGLGLLADHLEALGFEGSPQRPALVHSFIWRPAIETDHYGDGRDTLVSALRDAAVAVATADGTIPVVALLDRHDPALFARLALHVLRQVPDPALVAERLTSRELFDNAETNREYTLLLREQFAALPGNAQSQIVGFIQAGPLRDASPEDADRWRLQQLARFGDALPAGQQDVYEVLVGRFGRPEEYEHALRLGEFVGPTAPVAADALAAMADADLLLMLATWTPGQDRAAPSPEGLRLELQAAVERNPARFAALAVRFGNLDPTYARGLLAGLTSALTPKPAAPATNAPETVSDEAHSPEPGAGDRTAFDWTPVLAFGQAVLGRPRLMPGRPPTGDSERDPGWICCRQQLADLLAQGLRRNQIPPNRSDAVLTLLAQLAEDPEPDEEYEYADGHDDPATTAINTVRGCAFVALMRYAWWRHRYRPGTQPARLDEPVRAILEAHLDPGIEPTAAIRCVYGQFFGAITMCDPQWAHDHVEKVFDHTARPRLGATAWDAYLRFNHPAQQTYDLLAQQYRDSVTALSQRAVSTPASAGPDTDTDQIPDHLVRHIAYLYGHGIINLGTGSLVEAFTRNAPQEQRAKFIEVLGLMLHNTDTPAPAVLGRLQQLWEWRFNQLRTTPGADMGELAGFGWWFGSGKLGPHWAFAHLQELLEAGGTVEPDHLVADQLATYRSSRIEQSVTCLALLIDAATDPWFVTGSRDDIGAVLADGLRAADRSTQRRARQTINRLVARGHTAFADLLGR